MRTFRCLATLTTAALVLGAALPAAASGPRDKIQTAVVDVLGILRSEGLQSEQKRKRIEDIAYDVFDFASMSTSVLGPYAKRFTPEQKQEFVKLFRDYLAVNYSNRIDRYEQEDIAILGERDEVKVGPYADVTVLTQVVGGQFDKATIDYRLRERKDEWRVIDVTIEGVSLVSNYRDQFKQVLANGGPEKLLAQLRSKVESGQPDEIESAGGAAAASQKGG